MINLTKKGVKSCNELLLEFLDKDTQVMNPIKLVFQGIGDKDVYNITAPFEERGRMIKGGRVEARDDEHSEVIFFIERDGQWIPYEDAPVFTMQDPFYTRIGGELILGGVQTYPHPTPLWANQLAWRTVFYKGANTSELKPFFIGPDGMKDLRLVELNDGSIGIFTRPQGEKGGLGKIGFTTITTLAALSLEVIENAPLLDGQFIDSEWGGVNEAHLLRNGLIGVLGHIACFDEKGHRQYYPMVFALDPVLGEYSDMELISMRTKFLPGAAKRFDLVNVVFGGGLFRNNDKTADLYAGVSDAEAHRITIPDPFIKFERYGVRLNETYRYEENPLITPADVVPFHNDFEVIGAFNAGVAEFRGETLLLLRVAERPISQDPNIVLAPLFNPMTKKLDLIPLRRDDERYDFSDSRIIKDKTETASFAYLTSISYIRVARSKDGHHFTIDEKPLLYPSNDQETLGIEDPRVTQIGDMYYIYYSAISQNGIGVSMVSTQDFVNFVHHGLIFCPDNKDVIIFPEKINGKYYALHRPTTKSIGKPEIWIAESDNLLYWGNHKHLIGLRDGMWDSGRIGGGAVPIKTDQGWLELYHGATKDHRYCMGAVLLDINDPTKVIARSALPILEPKAVYEKEGFFGDVVFSCGAILEGDIIKMYYGVADTSMACAELSLKEILNSLI